MDWASYVSNLTDVEFQKLYQACLARAGTTITVTATNLFLPSTYGFAPVGTVAPHNHSAIPTVVGYSSVAYGYFDSNDLDDLDRTEYTYSHQGKKLLAIKAYRSRTGKGLKEAKDRVEDHYKKYENIIAPWLPMSFSGWIEWLRKSLKGPIELPMANHLSIDLDFEMVIFQFYEWLVRHRSDFSPEEFTDLDDVLRKMAKQKSNTTNTFPIEKALERLEAFADG